jgi:hypothetical protein
MRHSHIPLDRSVLCLDCDCISDGIATCSCCGSKSLLLLANLLNRTSEQDSASRMWRELEALRLA